MAKRSYRKKSKIQPAVQRLTYLDPLNFIVPAGSSATFYIDLSQSCSQANRRFYRQGINWAVAGLKVASASGTTASISVKKVPNTWVSSNAWEKAFRSWQKQQNEALEEGGNQSMKARFNDFKVFADVGHVAAGFAANLLPLGTTGGTWEPSKIVLPNVNPDGTGSTVEPAQRFLHMVGVNVNGASSRGIIEGYADSRAVPQSPDPVGADVGTADNWMARMFDVGNDMQEVLDNATLRNDTLPYPKFDYPGGAIDQPQLEIHDFEYITQTTIGGTTLLKGGNFPCGLMKIEIINTSETPYVPTLFVDLIPGNHRGYLCEPMTEM